MHPGQKLAAVALQRAERTPDVRRGKGSLGRGLRGEHQGGAPPWSSAVRIYLKTPRILKRNTETTRE